VFFCCRFKKKPVGLDNIANVGQVAPDIDIAHGDAMHAAVGDRGDSTSYGGNNEIPTLTGPMWLNARVTTSLRSYRSAYAMAIDSWAILERPYALRARSGLSSESGKSANVAGP
jgi:hypothetical protein